MHAVRVAPVVAAVLGLLVIGAATGCDAISGHHSAAPVASQLSTSAAVVSRPAGHASPAIKGKSSGGVQNLMATAAVRSALLQAYVAMKHIPASDVAGSKPDSVYYGYDKATKTYWAMASYETSSKASQAVQVNFQDGGDTGLFKRVGAGTWQASLGGMPGICVELRFFPKAVLAAWSLPTTHPASMC
ncbi:hypothetical protein EAS64_14145 [Trebonia kvetii]|uniref:DUF3558 domain-containing protein n=1 Tax=Trebonia kvetii TaxID=2480626 RepID=A0A6P2C2L3_9ACTN|nr:hypothetical protein [Trebonia kvetii]TVZ05642.1 hypothetical protein EAS64_14145 [Trebonia kvetii]